MEVITTAQPSPDFWTRQRLQNRDRDACLRAVQKAYSKHGIEEFGNQGYCSYTLLATLPTTSYAERDAGVEYNQESGVQKKCHIIQLRPAHHAFDLSITCAARTTYSSMAPKVRSLDLILPGGLHAYEMEKLPGTPFDRLQPCHRTLHADTGSKLEGLITSFADLIAQSWPSAPRDPAISTCVRADSPVETFPSMLGQCTGRVGSTLTRRLQKLASELPVAQLRSRAQSALMAMDSVVDYPVVLNHGDLIPSNILVDEDTWRITGIVDWAEAEYLPFGMCLYGLEHLLGSLAHPPSLTSQATPSDDRSPAFVYYENAAFLRNRFWSRLLEAVPELRSRKEDVMMMRDAGVLLWRGIAWDNGAMDRVVNEMDDTDELTYLRAFLGAPWCDVVGH